MTRTASRTRARAAAPSRVHHGRFVVVTGLSGSGKSQAIRALEDLGYFCVDNLPTTLIPTLASLTTRASNEMERAAVVVDIREGAFLSEFPRVWRELCQRRGLAPALVFLEARDEALVRRFSETRRPHPLAPDRSAIEGIREERKRLAPIRKMADVILDTSDMTVHELRRAFMDLWRAKRRTRLVVTLLSFGFKHGVPLDADLVLDVRFLPNPHFVPGLRQHTGRDAPVRRYLQRSPLTGEFLQRSSSFLKFLIPQYVQEGKSYLTVALGCTGGRHRSVAIAEALKKELAGLADVKVRVSHRDMEQE